MDTPRARIASFLFVPALVLSAGALLCRADTMTVKELIAELAKSGAGEVKLLEAYPCDLEETRPDFLGGAVYVRVVVRHPHHPHVLDYVLQAGKPVYRLRVGEPELRRLREEVKFALGTPEAALRYAQWTLRLTEGPAYWPVASVGEVPYMPARAEETELAARIRKSKEALASKIEPASARAEGVDFVVRQTAVKGRDLVRYDIRVTAQGKLDVRMTTVATDVPVVYVAGD
ncbi:MAG: hypothetical protein HYZ53_04425 [Planctomycetes bacterium]|nr:hypothetical protein [Planctomycetota bacterium]